MRKLVVRVLEGLVDLLHFQGIEEAAGKGIVRGEKRPAGAEARFILLA
jgi:hypothetical protein